MQGTILLNFTENTHQIEEEEKSRFLRGLLDQMFENTELANKIQEIWNTDQPLNAINKIKLRNILSTYNLQVIDNLDGSLKVYLDNEMVAEWYKCSYKLKKDLMVKDPKKRVFLEMEVKYWTVFEETEQEI